VREGTRDSAARDEKSNEGEMINDKLKMKNKKLLNVKRVMCNVCPAE